MRSVSCVTSTLLGKIGCALMKTPACRLWHDQVIEKPGSGSNVETRDFGNVGWHQDYAYWQVSDTTNMVTAWVALQDTTLTNGAMMTLVLLSPLGDWWRKAQRSKNKT